MSTRTNTLDLSISEAISDFAQDARNDLLPRTIRTYGEAQRLFESYAASRDITTVRQVTTDTIRDWLSHLHDTGRTDATLYNRWGGVNALMRYAADEKLVDTNVATRARP